MRKLLLVAAGSLVFAITGLALARGLDNARSVRSVAGTFTATTVSDSQMRSCTTADGKTIVATRATYTGTASGDPDLSGPITLVVRSTIDTTDGFGVLDGRLRIAASGGDTVAGLNAVYDHGAIAGFIFGRAKAPRVVLLGNLSVAGFTATGGFTGGKIGGGTAGGSAVELGPGRCAPEKPSQETSDAHGSVSALSSTSITVGGLTCAIPANLAAKVASTVKVGDRAEIECSLTNGVNTLLRIKTKHKDEEK
jgi:hypothetical protein